MAELMAAMEKAEEFRLQSVKDRERFEAECAKMVCECCGLVPKTDGNILWVCRCYYEAMKSHCVKENNGVALDRTNLFAGFRVFVYLAPDFVIK